MTNLIPLPRPASRLSAKLRLEIHARVTQGLTIAAACRSAGLSQAGWHKAMQRPAVVQHMQEVQGKFIAEADLARVQARAVAIQTALELMQTTKDEKIKARMCEFLAGDGKGPAVAFNVDLRQVPPTNYAYIRPTALGGTSEGES